MSFIQYLKDTRGELRHVAWPTNMQTIIYTALVVAISLIGAAYLGFFDYVFTTGLARGVQLLPEASSTFEQTVSTTTNSIILDTDTATPIE